MPLEDDIKLLDNNRAAANLLAASKALRAQQTQVQADIATKRPAVKSDIENDIWVFADIKEVVDLMSTNIAINQQHARNKADLQTLRPLLTDPNYQAELLAEENELP